MNVITKSVGVCLLVGGLSACNTLSHSEESQVRELKGYGLRQEEERKSPGVAGALNLLPGFGNFYLASGTDESGQWLYGFLNLLTWPVSILWGVPEAVVDAGNINKREMVYYYSYDPAGKAALAKAKAEQPPAMSMTR